MLGINIIFKFFIVLSTVLTFLLAFLMLVGVGNIRQAFVSLKSGKYSLKKCCKFMKKHVNNMPCFYRFFIIICILWVFLTIFFYCLSSSQTCREFWINFILVFVLTIFPIFFIYCFWVALIERIFKFMEEHKKELDNILTFVLCLLITFYVITLLSKKLGNINFWMFVILLAGIFMGHLLVLKGMLLVAMEGNPFKNENYKRMTFVRNIWFEALWWLLILIAYIFLEVLVCYSFDNSAFAFENDPNRKINKMDLLYFSIGTFLGTGVFYLEPNNLFSKMVTLGILFSSIVYIAVFISSILSTMNNGEKG